MPEFLGRSGSAPDPKGVRMLWTRNFDQLVTLIIEVDCWRHLSFYLRHQRLKFGIYRYFWSRYASGKNYKFIKCGYIELWSVTLPLLILHRVKVSQAPIDWLTAAKSHWTEFATLKKSQENLDCWHHGDIILNYI